MSNLDISLDILYGVNANKIIFVFVLYCIELDMHDGKKTCYNKSNTLYISDENNKKHRRFCGLG